MDDAANMLAAASASSTYGANGFTADIARLGQAAATPNGCALSITDTISRKSTTPTGATYSYVLYNTHKLFCNTSGAPDNVSGTITYSGNYNNANLVLTNSGTTTYTLAGLTQTATVYSLSGEYKSTGTFKLKSDTTQTGTVSIDLVLKNLTIAKSNLYITGGTATAIVTGTSVKNGGFTYNGTLTFNNSYTATLMINGNTYTIDILTGVVTKK